MAAMAMELGAFGDERLAKRGVCFSAEWLRARAFVFAAWRAGDAATSSRFGGSWPILG